MKRLLAFLLLSCIGAVGQAISGQMMWANPTASSTVTLVVTLTGSGTGSIADNQTQINTSWNGAHRAEPPREPMQSARL